MHNSEKIILDLCGGTGSWSAPYKRAGYDVRIITLPENDVMSFEPPQNIYGVLAAPPCTVFCLAKNMNKDKRDIAGGLKIVRRCLEIIWECNTEKRLQFWALENPRALLRQYLGKPYYCFEHWQYGERVAKPTDIWGYFNKPKRTVSEMPVLHNARHVHTMYPLPRGYIVPAGVRPNYVRRAITPAGFAKAFKLANP